MPANEALEEIKWYREIPNETLVRNTFTDYHPTKQNWLL